MQALRPTLTTGGALASALFPAPAGRQQRQDSDRQDNDKRPDCLQYFHASLCNFVAAAGRVSALWASMKA
jgi:hypothetical protein